MINCEVGDGLREIRGKWRVRSLQRPQEEEIRNTSSVGTDPAYEGAINGVLNDPLWREGLAKVIKTAA